MLRLGPPYFNIADVTVMGDAHDPRQFYYFPNRPKLAVDEQNRPAIRFIILREALEELDENEEDVAGFLVFDTDLAWPEQTLSRVKREIEQDLELDGEARLAPLPYRRGTVQLTFLDRTTTPPDPDRDDDDDDEETPAGTVTDPDQQWVPFLQASGVPSLYGSNRAIFSAMLSRKATKLLFGAFEGFMPAGVVYNLEFVGMQRAYNVHVKADWEQVYHFLQRRFQAENVFFQVDIDDILEELEDERLITIEASLEVVGEEAAGVEEEFNAVRQELQDLILDSFFEAVPNPNAVEPEGDGTFERVIEGARRVRNLVSGWPSAGYTRREVDISEIRSLQADYTVRRAAARNIAPQAHISLFFEDFGLTRDDIVTVVDGNDAMWNQTQFDASLSADFEGDGIDSVALDVQYARELITDADPDADPDAQWSFLFEKEDDRVKRSAWFNPEVGHSFFYRFKVFFKPAALPGPGGSLDSGWRHHDSQLLVVSPQDLYRKRTLVVQPSANFPFERYPETFVTVRYDDPELDWHFEDAKLLNAGDLNMSVAFRTRHDADQPVDLRFTYMRADGRVIETGWESTAADLKVVTSPDPPNLEITVIVGGDRSKIATLIVDLKYEDPENEVFESTAIFINQDNVNDRHAWRVPWKDPSRRRYQYSQTLIDLEGNVTVTGFQYAEAKTLVVGDTFVRLMEVQPEVAGPPFFDHDLERIFLKLRYEDPANSVLEETEQEFAQPGKGTPWRIELKDAGARDYTWQAVYVLDTGFTRTTGALSSRDNFLIISSVPPGD